MKLASNKRVLIYIKRNQGLTACQLCRLLERTYNSNTQCSYSTKLRRLEKEGKIIRMKSLGATQDVLTWRHYSVSNLGEAAL